MNLLLNILFDLILLNNNCRFFERVSTKSTKTFLIGKKIVSKPQIFHLKKVDRLSKECFKASSKTYKLKKRLRKCYNTRDKMLLHLESLNINKNIYILTTCLSLAMLMRSRCLKMSNGSFLSMKFSNF